jgi:hypothetical protein
MELKLKNYLISPIFVRESLTGFLYFKNVLDALRWFLTVESKDSFELEGFVQIHRH